MKCQGCFTPLVTPFDDNGNVDLPALRVLIERQIDAGVDGIVTMATTGETPTISSEEQHEILQETVRIVAKRIPLIVGTGSYCTKDSVENAKQAQLAGADAFLAIFPYYNRPSPLGVRRHIEEMASVGIPLILYHNPIRTGIRSTAKALADLMTIPEVIGIKECSGDMSLAIQLISMTEKPVLTGDDGDILPFTAVGGKGVISMMANLIPKTWKRMVDLCLLGDFSSAREIFYRYYALSRSLLLETNPQCVKYALSLMGLCRSHLRLPLLEPQESVQEEVHRALDAQGLLSELSLTR